MKIDEYVIRIYLYKHTKMSKSETEKFVNLMKEEQKQFEVDEEFRIRAEALID